MKAIRKPMERIEIEFWLPRDQDFPQDATVHVGIGCGTENFPKAKDIIEEGQVLIRPNPITSEYYELISFGNLVRDYNLIKG